MSGDEAFVGPSLSLMKRALAISTRAHCRRGARCRETSRGMSESRGWGEVGTHTFAARKASMRVDAGAALLIRCCDEQIADGERVRTSNRGQNYSHSRMHEFIPFDTFKSSLCARSRAVERSGISD